MLVASLGLFAQYDMNAPVPLDPQTRTGKLPNGMTYYVRHNAEPKERASFYIIQNVGAILENDDQNGLAHFLEHMAFNGTKNFPGRKGITSMLEKHGVEFGRNVNAYTAQDETVYNISDVPTTNPGLLDTCLLVLHDWSSFLILADGQKHFTRIGRPSNGSTGQPIRFSLGHGFSARICTKKDTYPDGRPFVGVGIKPDIVVEPTAEDFIKGRDAQLEAALDFLKKQR